MFYCSQRYRFRCCMVFSCKLKQSRTLAVPFFCRLGCKRGALLTVPLWCSNDSGSHDPFYGCYFRTWQVYFIESRKINVHMLQMVEQPRNCVDEGLDIVCSLLLYFYGSCQICFVLVSLRLAQCYHFWHY